MYTEKTDVKSCDFTAEAIVHHLASGASPSPEEAVQLPYAPEICRMRELVKEQPPLVDRLVDLVTSETGARPAFALQLLRYPASQASVATKLRMIFESRSITDVDLGCHLIWRILDDPMLPQEWHMRLFTYATDRWTEWKRHLEQFHTGPELMMAVIQGRFDDPSYPPSKKWIYLLCLPDGLAADQHLVRQILVGAAQSTDTVTRRVGGSLLDRFRP
jgi:hypothetical protein